MSIEYKINSSIVQFTEYKFGTLQHDFDHFENKYVFMYNLFLPIPNVKASSYPDLFTHADYNFFFFFVLRLLLLCLGGGFWPMIYRQATRKKYFII